MTALNNVAPKRLLAIVLVLAGLCQSGVAQDATVPTAAAVTEPMTFRPFRRGITATVQLPANLQALRRSLVAGKSLRTADLRALADAGDSLAQLRFAKQLSEMEDPDLVRAQLHYYAMAAYNGRDGAVRPMLSLLRVHGATLDAAVLSNAEAALLAQAARSQADAIAGLAKFYLAGAPFGSKGQEGLDLMSRVANAGNHQAALDLALQLIGDEQDAAGLARARPYLEIAATAPDLAVRTVALSLLNSDGGL